MNRTLALIPFALLALPATAAGDIRIENAWIREAPPVASVQAGYFRACNDGNSEITLERVESDEFARVEMHETVEQDGSSRMQSLDSVTIAAGDCTEFTRGGRHLMLFDPDKRLVDGDLAHLRLVFDTTTIAVEFPVRRGDGGNNHHHGH